MRICIGGTFNRLHKGHKLLIDTAIRRAGKKGFVFIGLSTGELLSKKSFVEPYEVRRNLLLDFLNTKTNLPTVLIEPITTVEGPTLQMNFDEIIVSFETKEVAKKINKKRNERGLKEMNIIAIPLVLAKDEKKISSTRIINGEIDNNGKIQ